MSFLNNPLTLVAIALLGGLGFVLSVHQFSKEQTAAHLRRVEQIRAEEKVARDRAAAARLEMLNARVAAAAEHQAQYAAAQEKAARDALVAALPGDPSKGRGSYMVCMACHGMNGEGQRAFNSPRLSGLEPWYIKRQLLKFKEGVRGMHPQDIYGMQMAPMAKLIYNEETLDNVVAHIASLEPGKTPDGGSGDAAAGKQQFAVCALCHGRQAEGMAKQQAPKLSNQHAWYLEKQIKNFKSKIRGAHELDSEGKLMIPIVQMLEDDKVIADLIAYIQSHN